MKIKKQATSRHEATLSPMIAGFAKAIEFLPLHQLPGHLQAFPKLWPFPRGDTYHWIPVLNRFDRILELFTQEYGLVDGPQTQPFERRLLLKGDGDGDGDEDAPSEPVTADVLDSLHMSEDADRVLIEQILNFTRILLENCGNRSLYSSSGHLDKLLNTTSISLLKATLRLTLRLSQRYHAARTRLAPASLHPTLLASHYNINLDKVQKLAGPLPKGPSAPNPLFASPAAKGKDKAQGDCHGEHDRFSPADMVGLFALSEPSVKKELGGVSISYYESTSTTEENKPAPTDAPATPTPARRTSNLGPQQTPRQTHAASSTDSPVTPGFTPGDLGGTRTTGPISFELSADTLAKSDVHQLLKQSLVDLPESVHYELLHKIRVANTVVSGHAGREEVVAIRLLSIANLAYVHGDKDFQSRIGQQDAEEPRRLQWAYQLAELVHPPSSGQEGISMELQTFAIATLEALAKHKSKAGDICTSLNVNVNHGVLFYVVRKLVMSLAVEDGEETDIEEEEWREALFSLLNTLPTSQQRTGDGMVSAGLLSILVQVLKLRTSKAERNYPKILNFLDTFVYNLREAFQSLVDAKGLDIISELVHDEVIASHELWADGKGMPKEYKTQLTDYQIPFYHQQSLRWLFKFMNHMMSHTGGGNFDRQMRNLIDSTPLQYGLGHVLSNANLFGSTVWSMAVNILTTFIHNEPTSYSVINDAGLSTALLETVAGEKISESSTDPASDNAASADQNSSTHTPRVYPPRVSTTRLSSGILPVAEAISTIPPAFGAICLAEAGMKLFQQSSALKRFFEIFESPAHVKALDQDPEIATMIGNSFDELVRHHPALKNVVITSLSEMVARVVRICFDKAAKDGAGAKLYYEGKDGKIQVCGGRLALAGPEGFVHKELSQSSSTEGDVQMKDAVESVTLQEVIESEDGTDGPTTNQFISVVCRFLGGFFTNHTMCSAYIEADGVESILDLATLPCLDARFNETRTTSEEFSRVVQVLVEQKPHIAVPAILKRIQQALDRLEPLMRHPYQGGTAFFGQFTNASSEPSSLQAEQEPDVIARGTDYVKSLLVVHTLVAALTTTFQGQMYNSRTGHNFASQVNLADLYARAVDSLGRLHRSCVWEEILLQKNMPTEWEKETRIKSSGFGAIEADSVFHLGDRPSAFSSGPAESSGTANSDDANASPDDSPAPSQHSARFKNTQILRYLLSKIPTGIAPFCQSLGKLILLRRSLDTYQKQCAVIVGDQLAQAAIDQLNFEAPKAAESSEDRYAYWIVILTSLSQLLIDSAMDRVSPQTLTLVLVSFYNLGGMAILADILDTFHDTAEAVVRTQGDNPSEESQRLLNLSLGGVKIVLALYAQIINAKTITEASQTTTLHSQPNRERERPDYFTAPQFIVELRYAVTSPVRKIWDSDLIDKATTSIVKTSINILKTILDGDGESGAYKTVDKIPKRNKPIIKPWAPRHPEHLERLKESSFEESLAEEALFRCNDIMNSAREYCHNQVHDIRASRNPIPQYEINARGPPTASASRAEVIVPEHSDDISVSSGDGTGDGEDSETHDSHSVEMGDADAAQDTPEASVDTPVPDAQPALEPSGSIQDGLAYQKRTATGNLAEPVAIDDLDKERASIREQLVGRSLDILNSHDGVTFELADLVSAAVAKATDPASMRGEIGSTLVHSLISLQTGDDFRAQGKKIAASAHLLALIIQDKEFYDAVVDELKENLTTFLGFIKIFPDQSAEESSPWIGQILVIIERLLAEDQLPHQIAWTPPSSDSQEETSVEDLPEPIISLDEKNQLFDALVEVLPRIGKDESLALSVTRILVMLTRTRKIALRLAEKRNIQRLFLMVRQLAGITNESLRSAFMIVLRHIIEDEAMIRQIMRSEIQSMFESRDRRQTDTANYARQMYYMVIRAPEIFVEVTNEKLQLARFDPNQRPQTLMLKKAEAPTDPDAPVPTDEGASSGMSESDRPKETSEPVKQPVLERTKTSDLKVPVVENTDGAIHYLLCELLAYKEIDDKPEAPKSLEKTDEPQGDQQSASGSSTAAGTPAAEVPKTEKADFKADAHPIYIYRCFILKCLAELLQSYNRTKIEFINFSRRADPQATTPSKPRSGVLNYLLNTLVPVGSLNHDGDIVFKKKLATSGCAIDVIVSLCAKTGEHGASKPNQPSPYVETEMDLLFVRKFVLEHSLKAFKDASASDEPLDMKYSRLLGIADIFSRMVSQRPNGEMLTQNSELTPTLKQMAKIMYEKNCVSVLTTAIADIDLNFPNAKRVVKYILKPLKWLCFVAMDLSTRYDTSSTPESIDEYEISSASDDDLMETSREETPDLFRNSTLGMFEPNNESETEGSDDGEDEEMEMYDEAFADDMEFDEEIGDNDEVVSEDEEMEMELGDMGPIEGLPGDVDVEIELDEDIDQMNSDDDSPNEDEEGDEDDEDEDEEDDDEDDDEEMDGLEDLEEITGDDENASLADDREDSWSADDVDYPGAGAGDLNMNMAPGDLGFVLDQQPQQMLEQLQRDFIDAEAQEEEDEEDEDEEEYDEEDIVYDPGMDDEDGDMDIGGWGWDDAAPPAVRQTHRLSPWMFPGGPDNRILVPAYRSHRPGGGPRMNDDGVNPLLQRSGRSGGRNDPFAGQHGMSDWVHAIEARGPRLFTSDSPVSFISNLLNAMSQGQLGPQGGAVHLSFGGNNMPLGLPPLLDTGAHRNPRIRESPLSRSREDPQSAVSFLKAYTNQRWQEEARMLYGNAAAEKSQRVLSSILKVMVPPALEAAKKRQAEREAEAARKLKEDQERKEKEEREKREAKEKKEREDRERQEREAAAAATAAAAQAAEQSQPSEAEGDTGTVATSDVQAMEGVESTETAGEQPAPAEPAEPSEPRPRVTTTLRGQEYDITDLGIDLDYLEELPEEFREEVLMQQIAERRALNAEQQRATAQTGEAASNRESGQQQAGDTGIDEQFLAALPPEIRQELLQHEAQERRRSQREEQRRRAQTASNGPPQPEEIDTASFLASLDPELRQAVLMDQDEEVLRQLPPEISAEARALGGDRRLNQFDYLPSGYRHRTDRRALQDDPTQKRKARPCVQMLDKAGVATLLRLMFIPQQGSAKASLTQILRYVCENRQNRAEVISILLSILQDGSADVNAVERSFAQLSLRAKQVQQPSDKTPKLSRKNGALSINSEVSPLMVVQQCLNTLTQLTDKNPAVWSFFLSEHETAVGFKGRGNRKGKAKETKATKYPINALLSLLDRKLIIESSSIMEQLTMLLKVITTPLPVIKKNEEKAATDAKKNEGATQETAPNTAAPVTEQPAPSAQQQSEYAEMTTAPAPNAAQATTPAGEGSSTKPDAPKPEDEKKKHRTMTPPDIPESNLRLVAKILAARECNSKVFQGTLDVIGNLSPIPGSKEVFGQELLSIAQDLARSALKDLTELTNQVAHATSPTDVQGITLSKFSPASSDQTKLLRALTALDYLFDPNRDKKDRSNVAPDVPEEALENDRKDDILNTLYEDSAFAPLWSKLGECLTVIRQRGNMLNIATTLLPLIETLMVVCKNTTLKDTPLNMILPKEFALGSPPPEKPPENKMENLFFNFTEDHRKILNDLVRQNPKLMSGTFSLLVRNSKVLEFDNKRNYFNRKIHARTADRQPHQPLQLAIRRDQVFMDSFKSLYFKTADEMKYGKLSIRFHGEEGVDAGGVTREWFQVIARQMFDPNYALFIPVASDRTTFHPNRLSGVNQEHLMFFKFIGRIIGKALYEGRVLDCHFSRAVYKRILGRPVNLKDMETLDLEYYKSLLWMLENDITDIITETFSTDVEAFGETEVVDLIENGRNIPVTEENKHEYVRLVTEHRLTGAVQEQLEHFLRGFHDIIPAELISIFSEQELELLISGLPDINIEDWKANTEYHNYTQNSPQIHWFWRAVRSFDKEEQAKLLQFVTGTSKVPLNGFKELEGMNGFSKFNIHRDYGSKDRLPSSHTCFNQLDLPEYEDYEALKKALYTAMTAGGEYFGFA
ncbi:hypothetical protein CC80DRAFT_99904 [Byssothecium circinans]|uniref:HECT-type E3 ubiquitin transferase n=1 Tax=Byssothecium circinans TaxID=147558 RepID=A0A6A5UJ05_9PLEO|nr:hypothetical protein CC80DRAFT_99904 [Byssothecium circinans]